MKNLLFVFLFIFQLNFVKAQLNISCGALGSYVAKDENDLLDFGGGGYLSCGYTLNKVNLAAEYNYQKFSTSFFKRYDIGSEYITIDFKPFQDNSFIIGGGLGLAQKYSEVELINNLLFDDGFSYKLLVGSKNYFFKSCRSLQWETKLEFTDCLFSERIMMANLKVGLIYIFNTEN